MKLPPYVPAEPHPDRLLARIPGLSALWEHYNYRVSFCSGTALNPHPLEQFKLEPVNKPLSTPELMVALQTEIGIVQKPYWSFRQRGGLSRK